MTRTYGVGIIGAGNIAAQYLRFAPLFSGIELRAIADRLPEAAKARSDEFGVPQRTVDELLAADDIDLVVNLTIPDAHFDVSSAILAAGKHAYSEKPLCLTLEQGKQLKAAAETAGKQVGAAPDTFLGGAHQFARKLIDDGLIGRVHSGTCHVMSKGMEHWHPNPEFYFSPGGGPILDMGPYYLTNLVNLIGPARRVASMGGRARNQRTISSQPRAGEVLGVHVDTTVHAIIEFENGAIITLGASWDVFANGHANMELYGTEASLFVPDPNFFAGEVAIGDKDGERETLEQWDHPLGVPNVDRPNNVKLANYRSAGFADMVRAIDEGRPARCSLDTALHVLDIMDSILRSDETGEFVAMTTTCPQPARLDPDEARRMMVEA